jgi:hypothetical protein
MLRQAAARLLRQGARSFTTSAARLEGEAAPAGVKEFTEQWNKVAPSTLNLPELPSSFLKAEDSAESAVDGERFSVNFYTPHGVVAQTKVGEIQPTAARKLICELFMIV